MEAYFHQSNEKESCHDENFLKIMTWCLYNYILMFLITRTYKILVIILVEMGFHTFVHNKFLFLG